MDPHGGEADALRRTGQWCRAIAVVLGASSLAQLIAWTNRWYTTEQLARSMDGADADSARWVYERMAHVHDTLLIGVLLMLAAGAAAVLGARLAARARSLEPTLAREPVT